MTLLKLLFVLLILIPIALIMYFIIDNLLNDAQHAKKDSVDYDAIDRERTKRKKKKRSERAAEKKTEKAPKKKTAKRPKAPSRPAAFSETPSQRPARKKAKTTRKAQTRPKPRPAEPPMTAGVTDHSQDYLNEYNRRRAEIERGSRQAGRRNTLDEFDFLYGGDSSKSRTTRKSSGKGKSKKTTKSKKRVKK